MYYPPAIIKQRLSGEYNRLLGSQHAVLSLDETLSQEFITIVNGISLPHKTELQVIVVPWASRVYGICTLRVVICIPPLHPREYI